MEGNWQPLLRRVLYRDEAVVLLSSVPSVCSLGRFLTVVGGVVVGFSPCGKWESMSNQSATSGSVTRSRADRRIEIVSCQTSRSTFVKKA